MTFKLKKTEPIKALLAVLCMLAVALAVLLILPRGVASADEADAEATYTVTWEYRASADGEWASFVAGKTLFTYEADEDGNGKDYSALVRAKIDLGEETEPTYVYYNAAAEGKYLSYSGTFDGQAVDVLVNATEYTVTMNGTLGVDVAEDDRSVKIKIAPRVFDLSESDFVDYYGIGESNRLWLLSDKSELGDLSTYYDPAAEFNSDYGAKVTTGVLYNAYARYTGKQQKIVLNDEYKINNKTLKDYSNAISKTEDGDIAIYSGNVAKGDANKVNKITSSATITLTGNWVLQNGGGNKIEINKDWYIVTINNALRTLDGYERTSVEGWTYGSEIPQLSIRPEHGDNAVFTLGKDGSVISRFAVKYSGIGTDTVLSYYDVKQGDNGYEIDTENELDGDYCTAQLEKLGVGAYTLNVAVPAYTSTNDHVHWWPNAEDEAASVVYYPISRTYHFTVACYELTAENISFDEADNKDFTIKLLNTQVEYNGQDNNFPELEVTFRGEKLVYDVDYDLLSDKVGVGKAPLMFVGKNRFTGMVPLGEVYEIVKAYNSWKDVPSIMYWTYGNYDKQMNLIKATPTYLDNVNDVSFKVTTDMAGEIPVADALAYFQLTDGIVSDDVANSLSALPVGTYYLFASVKASTNYRALVQRGVAFKVFPATNSWEVTPAIVVWTEGQFKSTNLPVAKPLFGTANIVIKDSDGKDVYNNVTGVNRLSTAKAGTYTLAATVIGSNDYNGLEYSTVFSIHEKPGIPVWATVLIVLGALLVVALIIFILIKVGVLRILTDKLMVSIRTQAAVDATVAAIRANKKNEESKQLVAEFKQQEQAEAKKEERKKARKARAAEQKALPVEQKIAALEEKVRKAEARAEKIRIRAEIMQQRADRMRESANPAPEQTEQPVTEPAAAEAAATETTETPTEN